MTVCCQFVVLRMIVLDVCMCVLGVCMRACVFSVNVGVGVAPCIVHADTPALLIIILLKKIN